MRFFGVPLLVLATGVAALPPSAGGEGSANGVANKGNVATRFPVPESMTVKQAQAKCGDQAQLSCCNKATWAGDTTDVNDGILAGTLSHLVGTGSGAEGLGLFNECSQLDVQVPLLFGLAAIQDLVKKKCQQNIACCQNSPSSANGDLIGLGLPCVALGALI
ncbi:uncharacterized protein N7482_010747 [Penicillium canariense]|uniref:Hydrophobin n=1 Tax=Penicillium canariense TaxID=189055 RepID=A0A9W9HMS4_9EURO|nr:uncharacterized protein N7482_010747 [Penicillium canariense]KAJ5151495.1 hypothetical protein N7482_010747 [Penicillium canariense]